MNKLRLFVALTLVAITLMTGAEPTTNAWGDEGHRFINLVAAQHLPDDMPAFLRNASTRLSFLGPEPDRWRDNRNLFKALTEVNGRIILSTWTRRENSQRCPTTGLSIRIGACNLKSRRTSCFPVLRCSRLSENPGAFRLWRYRNTGRRRANRAEHCYYAGVARAYVADASQPLHTTFISTA